jgi:hypothetical protein
MSSDDQKMQNKEKKSTFGRGIVGRYERAKWPGPLNLAIRFLLEIAALVALGVWGWRYGNETWLKSILALGLPIIAAAIWGIFNVPNDPSRSGAAPIVVPGIVRLTLELLIFALATLVLYNLDYPSLSWLLGSILILHYLVSYDRILWLIKQ